MARKRPKKIWMSSYKTNGKTSKLVKLGKKKKILKLIENGNYDSVACQVVGISLPTLCNWKRKGREVEDRIFEIRKKLRNHKLPTKEKLELRKEREFLKDNEYYKFFKELKKAVAKSEASMVADVRKAGRENNWGAAMTMLERKFSDRWGKKTHITTDEHRTVEVNVTFREQLQELRKLNLSANKIEKIINILQPQLPAPKEQEQESDIIDVEYEEAMEQA